MSNRLQVTEKLVEANLLLESLRERLLEARVRAEAVDRVTGVHPSLVSGIEKLRQKLYEPSLDREIEALISLSAPSQATVSPARTDA